MEVNLLDLFSEKLGNMLEYFGKFEELDGPLKALGKMEADDVLGWVHVYLVPLQSIIEAAHSGSEEARKALLDAAVEGARSVGRTEIATQVYDRMDRADEDKLVRYLVFFLAVAEQIGAQ